LFSLEKATVEQTAYLRISSQQLRDTRSQKRTCAGAGPSALEHVGIAALEGSRPFGRTRDATGCLGPTQLGLCRLGCGKSLIPNAPIWVRS
jgi:hypothetical protein